MISERTPSNLWTLGTKSSDVWQGIPKSPLSQSPGHQPTHFISYQTPKPTLIHHCPHHSWMAKPQVIYAGSFKQLLINPIATPSHI